MCYARSVVGPEWEALEEGTLGEHLNPWGIELFRTMRGVEPASASEEAAYGKWLDQTADREDARNDRIHGAVGIIPTPLWVVLFLVAAIIFVFMLFFADSGERAIVQGVLMGAVVSVIVAMMLLLQFLDGPFRPGVGGLRPQAMERTLVLIEEELAVAGGADDFPCDDRGIARDS